MVRKISYLPVIVVRTMAIASTHFVEDKHWCEEKWKTILNSLRRSENPSHWKRFSNPSLYNKTTFVIGNQCLNQNV